MIDLKQEILKLKEEKNAVILAHYYQKDEIQEIADYIGDSLYLAQISTKLKEDVIVFCGVHFMAETTKILVPEKQVLLPELKAGCPMADMVNTSGLIDYKKEHPNAKIICYVNSTAEVKALSDICVTSSNAKTIAKHFLGEKLLYVPDQNLGNYLNEQIPSLNMDLWPGHCCIHNNLTIAQVKEKQHQYPEAKLIVHPEANPEVVAMADYVGSTKALLNYTINDGASQYIVGTEQGILYEMKRSNPDKEFILLSEHLVCRTMKMTNLEKVYKVLKENSNQITVDSDVASKAKLAIDRMLELS